MPAAKRAAREEDGPAAPRTVRARRALFAPSAPASSSSIKQEASSGDAALDPPRYALRTRTHSASTAAAATAESTDAGAPPSTSASTSSSSLALAPNTPSPSKKQQSFFELSPRKTNKPIKRELAPHEAHPPPKRWAETYALILQQRRRIVAAVDTLGCEEAGNDERRSDKWREEEDAGAAGESEEDRARRKRFTTLVSLMLSSQTRDPVTAAAVANLQRQLPGGLTVDSVIAATDEQIMNAIASVGFFRRKTGYVKSAARIIKQDFNGDVPKDVDELCSLPGVGPKMAYLCLQSAWQLNEGIGVDVHVHRITNRLGWHRKPTTEAEQTRLNLQSWLPKPLHREINRVLVGFGQVICLPVSPRCDLCALSTAKLCPSRRKVDPKSVESRVKVEFLPEDAATGQLLQPFPHKFRYVLDLDKLNEEAALVKKEEGGAGSGVGGGVMSVKTEQEAPVAATIKMEGPDGPGLLLAGADEASTAIEDAAEGAVTVSTAPASTSAVPSLEW